MTGWQTHIPKGKECKFDDTIWYYSGLLLAVSCSSGCSTCMSLMAFVYAHYPDLQVYLALCIYIYTFTLIGLVHINSLSYTHTHTHTHAGMRHSWGAACALSPLISGGVGGGSGYKSSSVCYSGLSPPSFWTPQRWEVIVFNKAKFERFIFFYYRFSLMVTAR